MNAKQILLSAGVLGAFSVYAVHLKLDRGEDNPVVRVNTPAPTDTTFSLSTPTLNPTPVNTPMGNGMMNQGQMGMMSRYKDGSYTGDVTDAFYGNVQVKVTISGGKITDVQFLQYPNDRQTSVEINSQAMPLLGQEAIQAQSAQVDGVSGATQTSGAFIQSLQTALQKAT